jgi:hypothetical protein
MEFIALVAGVDHQVISPAPGGLVAVAQCAQQARGAGAGTAVGNAQATGDGGARFNHPLAKRGPMLKVKDVFVCHNCYVQLNTESRKTQARIEKSD